jgi:hypothetical protein
MKKGFLMLKMLIIFTNCFSQAGSNKTYYLTHITVIDVSNGTTLPDMTVVITDSVISAVVSTEKVKIPGKAKVINCKGKYILPGLWDMHVHLGNATNTSLPLFIANGVTGVRDMGSSRFDSIQRWRQQINSGHVTGPRIIAPGPILNGGHPDQDYQIGVNSVEEARRIVDSLARMGVDFIKVHGDLTRETYYAIADEATKLHLPFAGHIPISNTTVAVTGKEASDAGQRSLEHMLGIPFARDTIQMYQHLYPTPQSLEDLFKVLVKNRTYITPTLSVYQVPPDYKAISARQDSLLQYISPELRSFWNTQIADWPKRNKDFMNWMLKARANMILPLRDAGIPLLAGTDTGFPFVLPGFGLHEELKYLVAAGLGPLEAIRAATINPVTFLGKKDRLGSVEKGKLADLIIVNADPMLNIQSLRFPEAVIANGKLYDRSALNNELKQVATRVRLAHQ